MFQLRNLLIQKTFKKLITIYLHFKYYKNRNNIIFKFQRLFSIKKSKNLFQIKTKQLKQKIKLMKKKKQKRFD